MNKCASFKAIIAVSPTFSIIVEAPNDVLQMLDGSCCEDNSFKKIPQRTGVYLCIVDYYFEQGYCDGYRADDESDWKFVITSATKIGLPSVAYSWEICNEGDDN